MEYVVSLVVLDSMLMGLDSQWSPLMYAVIDAEFFVSCFFFIICLVVLNFWLINLFVAVITNTFSAIRSQTQKSAFGAAACVESICCRCGSLKLFR